MRNLVRNFLSSHICEKFSHLTNKRWEKFSHIQQNSADQFSSSNKRLWLTIEKRFKDVKNAESFEKINTDFDVFERNKRLDLDEEVDEEDLFTENISTIEDQ